MSAATAGALSGTGAAALPAADVSWQVTSLEPGNETVQSLVADVIDSSLSERGLVGVSADKAAKGAAAPPAVLRVTVSTAGAKLQLTFTWSDATGAPDVTQAAGGPLDIHVDSLLLDLVDAFLSSAGSRVDELVAARAKARAAEKAAADAEAARVAAAAAAAAAKAQAEADAEARAQAARDAAAAAAAAKAKADADAAAAAAKAKADADAAAAAAASARADGGGAPAAPPHLDLRPSAAAFIPVGPAADYFAVGVAPSLTVAWDFPVSPGRLAIGVSAAGLVFKATGPLDSALTLFVPVGPDVRFTVGSGAPFAAWAHLSGGPALAVIAAQAQGTVLGMTGYTQSGLGASFSFGERFALGACVDLVVYFVQPWMVTGLSASLLAAVKP